MDSGVVGERAPRSPACASAAPHVSAAPRRRDSVTRQSADAYPRTLWPCTAEPVPASTGGVLHSPPVPGSRRWPGATRPGHTAGPGCSGAAQAPATPACSQVARPAVFFHPSTATLSGPLCWEHGAWHASWARSRWSRRPETRAGLSWWRRCVPGAIGGGCTPYIRAHAWTVLSPLSASSATRAVHSALYCFRGVDIAPRLLSTPMDTACYLHYLSSFRGTL